jgi:uncharacterized protein YjbI with pentapeptide repeats
MASEEAAAAGRFQPSPYVASLIAAINDGAKAAQGGALLFLLVGVYLFATAFSASDEDLLLGKTVTIAQVGTSLPVAFPFAIAPLVFVFLHIYTLSRYDMLAANLRHLLNELEDEVGEPSDREDCRQLLANIEFVATLSAPPGSSLYSRFWPWLFRIIVVVFPVTVLLLVQVNSLRYQSALILWAQRGWLALDLTALIWFFRRNALNGSVWPNDTSERAWRWARLVSPPVAILAVNLFYMNIVPADANPTFIHYLPPSELRDFTQLSRYLGAFVREPLDAFFCPTLSWGCRYLKVQRRTLVEKVWNSKAMAALRSPETTSAQGLANVEGFDLSGRSFRFAMLNDTRLYGANLTNADLQGAILLGANLSGATLLDANLQDAHLEEALLQLADLSFAHLQRAHLERAKLQGADLSFTKLQGASLRDADLTSADLFGAGLQGADLTHVRLQSAELMSAYLQGADLGEAQLQGATLCGAHLDGANLRGAQLWQVFDNPDLGLPPDFSLADLRMSDFDTPPTQQEQGESRQFLNALPGREVKLRGREQWLRECASKDQTAVPKFHASKERPVLVSEPPTLPKALANHREWLLTQPTAAYSEALAAYLGSELASVNSDIADGVAHRVSIAWPKEIVQPPAVPLAAPVGCRLLSEAKAGEVSLDQKWIDQWSPFANRCQSTASPANLPK